MANNEIRNYKIRFEDHYDYYICSIYPIPIVGRGASPLEALMSLARSIPTVYESWAENLSMEHVADSHSLPVYKALTYFVTNFQNEEELKATFYSPIK